MMNLHRCLTLFLGLAVCLFAAGAKKKPDPGFPRWEKMDVGPFFSATLSGKLPPGHAATPKAIIVRLGEEPQHAAAFDVDLLRMGLCWRGVEREGIGAVLHLSSNREGLGGGPHVRGEPLLGLTNRPGWARGESFQDPRRRKAGPLPKDWARYRGLYTHGKRVIFEYTVGGKRVLDSPGVVQSGGTTAFTRDLEIAASDQPRRLLIADRLDAPPGQLSGPQVEVKQWGRPVRLAVVGPAAARWIAVDERSLGIEIAPTSNTVRLRIVMGVGDAAGKPFASLLAAAGKPLALKPLARGGPPLWKPALSTRGVLGKADGPYAVDVLTAPYDNPWGSFLRFAGHDFFKNGDAAVCSISGDVWRVSGIDADLSQLRWRRYATGLHQPLGLRIVRDKVYVLERGRITRLHDLNDDGEADRYECFNTDTQVIDHGHAYNTCLETDPEGNFYYLTCTAGSQTDHDGAVLRVSADGSRLEVFATGFRNPTGMGVGPQGQVTVADQQGNWVPSSKIDLVRKGGFYGFMPSHHRKERPKTYDPPLCWIPHRVDNSCGGQTWIAGDSWGLPAGEMIHLSYGKCAAFLVLQDRSGKQRQGGVIQLPMAFRSGVMRARFRPADGQLYVSGLRGWQTSSATSGSLERARYTGKPVRLPTSFRVTGQGIELTFSCPLDAAAAADPDNYSVEQWNYLWSQAYGSKDYKVSNPKRFGRDEVEVYDARLLPDKRTVLIELEVQPVMQMEIRYTLRSADGAPMKGQVDLTIHHVGKG